MIKLKEIQQSLEHQHIDGWLLYDYRGSNPFAYTVLEIPRGTMCTRRFFYWIPKQGEPIKIIPQIEPHTLDHLPGEKKMYRSWQELERHLSNLIKGDPTIAMEYSPFNALPAVSKVDAGTIELVRKMGARVVSPAHLLQTYTSVWTEYQYQSHLAAAHILDSIVDRTWSFISDALHSQRTVTEYQVQQFMLEHMHHQGCITDHPPICAVNAHSADPHYSPDESSSSPIQKGDFILLDLWCKKKEPHAVYADIARVAVADSAATPLQRTIFNIVKEARDQTTAYMKKEYEKGAALQGWQVDQYCRDIIEKAGYGEFFIHRTGHNIGEQVHGSGANLDNLETQDFRLLLPRTCVSVEPGIYLPHQFGIRLEYDVYFAPDHHLVITGGIQNDLVLLT